MSQNAPVITPALNSTSVPMPTPQGIALNSISQSPVAPSGTSSVPSIPPAVSLEQPKGVWARYGVWIERVSISLAVILAIGAIVSGFWYMIDWRIGMVVKDPDYIAKVARRVRPSMVFDSDGKILVDTGAMELLERAPEVTAPQKGVYPPVTKIVIHPKEFLGVEPIIEALDVGNVSVAAKRSTGLSWEITVSLRDSLVTAGDVKLPEPSALRYRLELIPR